jgi:hypothetical protein
MYMQPSNAWLFQLVVVQGRFLIIDGKQNLTSQRNMVVQNLNIHGSPKERNSKSQTFTVHTFS